MPAQIVIMWGFIFTVPTLLTLFYTGGKTSLSREELLATETARRRVRDPAPAPRLLANRSQT